MPTDEANPWDDEAPASSSAADAETTTTDAATTDGTTPSGDVDLAETAPADTPAGDASDGDGPAGADDDEDDDDRRRVLVIAAVAFVIIAAVAFVLTRGGDDPADTTLPGDTRTATGGDAGGGAITISGTSDSFNREDTDDGLGALPSGAPWIVQSGSWAIRADEAVVTQPDAQRRNTVYVATGYEDPMAQVRLTTIANGAGMVFRYQGECNFWAVYAVPEYATWNVEKVIDCARVGGEDSETVYRTITGAPVGEGTTVGVVLSGEKVEIVLNGTIALTFEDPDLAGVGRLGLTTRGDADVAFDDFVAGGPGGQGIVGTTTPEGGGSTTTAAEGGSTTTAGEGGATTTVAEGDGGG